MINLEFKIKMENKEINFNDAHYLEDTNKTAIEGTEYLEPNFIIDAYSKGYFPMYEELYNAVLWHCPDPRAVIDINNPKQMSRSLKRNITKFEYEVKYDTQFETVMRKCADRDETWIIEKMVGAYTELHRLGFAHSVETYYEGQLVGGLYGLTIGGAFFGESMFSTKTDASKFAFYKLIENLKEKEFILLDSQYINDFTESLGATEIPLINFKKTLAKAIILERRF